MKYWDLDLRRSDMNSHSANGFLDGRQQFALKDPVMEDLVFRHVDDYNANLKLGEILLILQAAVNRPQYIEFRLGEHQKRPVFQRIPTTLVNGGNYMIGEKLLDTRIYALVNEDTHSRTAVGEVEHSKNLLARDRRVKI
jgi:hypothetical protein